jgi:hypothetical protein
MIGGPTRGAVNTPVDRFTLSFVERNSMPQDHITSATGKILRSKDRLYNIWQQMRQRCYNPRCKDYPHYGGRGIVISEEWRADFDAFRAWAVAHPAYTAEMTIERVSLDGGYCVENCTWVPRAEQTKNQRKTLWISAFGDTKRISDWVDDDRCSISRGTLSQRLRAGWNPEEAISAPLSATLVNAFGEVTIHMG